MSCEKQKKRRSATWTLYVGATALSPFLTAYAWGHGTNSINVFLDKENQLYVGPTFEAGPFVLFDSHIFTDLPGIAVLSPGNQVPDQSELGLDVLHGLLYWDGDSVEHSNAELEIQAPAIDGFGNSHASPTVAYSVTADSRYQTGMRWGIYDGRVPGWDSHGMFNLSPNSAPTGVYGVVLQVTSPRHRPTDPILVPLAYDPSGLGELDETEYANGVTTLSELAASLLTPLRAGDANQDLIVDQLDLVQVLRAGKYLTGELAAWHEGDWNGAPGGRVGLPPTGDGVFDQLDLVALLRDASYGAGSYATSGNRVAVIPEPSGVVLMAMALATLAGLGRFKRVS